MFNEVFFKIVFIVIYAIYLVIRAYFGFKIKKYNGKIINFDKDAIKNEGVLRVTVRVSLFIIRNIAIILYMLDIGMWMHIDLPNSIRCIVIVVAVISLVVLVYTQLCLGSFWTTSLKIADNHKLITDGIYKYMRHPMYLVLIGMMIFYSLCSCYLPIIIPSLIAIVTIYTRIGKEEKMLIQFFGDSYVEYMKNTNRLIPKFKLKKAISVRYIRLLKGIFKCCLINEIEYRLNFFLRATVELSYLILSLVMFDVIYMNVTSIAGWTKNEMLLLVLITNLLDSIITLLFNAGLSEIPKLVNEGTMDFAILKPINTRFYVTFRKFELSQLINVLINFAFSIHIINNLQIEMSISRIIILIFMLMVSVLIMYNIYFCIMVSSFWTVKVDIGVNLFYQLFHIGNKPSNIFVHKIKFIFTYIIPIFIAFNYPVRFLVSKITVTETLIAVFIAIAMTILSNIFFKFSLAKYSSAGC